MVAPVMVAGGARDPNLRALLKALEAAAVPTLPLLVSRERSPAVSWKVASGELWIEGVAERPGAVFLRHDVFGGAGDKPAGSYRSFAWYTTVAGWLLAQPEVRCANRSMLHAQLNKPYVLCLAAELGLKVPRTVVSNEPARVPYMVGAEACVAKPVTGGGYCRRLAELRPHTELRDGAAAAPCIVQPELSAPEVRVYQIGGETFAFQVISDALDYRTSKSTRVVPYAGQLDEGLVRALQGLLAKLGLQYGAADFKADPETGELVFLELNTAPMFSRFDQVSEGALCQALVRWLTASSGC